MAATSPAAINLSRLLLRLENVILLSADEDALLRASVFERKRLSANLAYARNLCSQLEHAVAHQEVEPDGQDVEIDLVPQKELIARLDERLRQLDETDEEEEEGSWVEGDGEDLLGDDAVAADEPNEGTATNGTTPEALAFKETGGSGNADRTVLGSDVPAITGPSDNILASLAQSLPDANEPESQSKTNPLAVGKSGVAERPSETVPVTSGERSLERRRPFRADGDVHQKGSQPASDTSALFGKGRTADGAGATTSSDATSLPQTEKLLSHHRIEQEDLTASLLEMAQALKASSQAFATSLESEKEVLGRASEGLDKNATGLEAAEKRMGALRRMTEGKGWLGRMLLYVWLMGLVMIALVIVGFLPKLRF
ncbi:MAG: hypothetical protein M1826_006659 [Phylliscum demangeonii]|nr:MAG: hypothetical protein M1826_006659 [Phylliscum demangeonii]